MPDWLQAALAELEPEADVEGQLRACDTILEYIEKEEKELRTAQATICRTIQRKIFKRMDAKVSS